MTAAVFDHDGPWTEEATAAPGGALELTEPVHALIRPESLLHWLSSVGRLA